MIQLCENSFSLKRNQKKKKGNTIKKMYWWFDYNKKKKKMVKQSQNIYRNLIFDYYLLLTWNFLNKNVYFHLHIFMSK